MLDYDIASESIVAMSSAGKIIIINAIDFYFNPFSPSFNLEGERVAFVNPISLKQAPKVCVLIDCIRCL